MCLRPYCRGLIVSDDDGFTRCLLCGREPNAPTPQPLLRDAKRVILPLAVLDDIEKARRKARAAYQRERRFRESHAISKAAQ